MSNDKNPRKKQYNHGKRDNYLVHTTIDKEHSSTVGASPRDIYARKAEYDFTHDKAPSGKIVDPKFIKKIMEMEGMKQSNDISTKNKVSVDYLKQLIDTKEMPLSR